MGLSIMTPQGAVEVPTRGYKLRISGDVKNLGRTGFQSSSGTF